jgi:pimeloyl-ACP methyl ester carboxylesterase
LREALALNTFAQPPHSTSRTSWYEDWLIQVAAHLYTHPKTTLTLYEKLIWRFSPGTPLLAAQYLYAFEPMVPVTFTTVDHITLKGHWLPGNGNKGTTVIMGHGYLMDWREMLSIAHPLRQQGYHVLLFDFRAHGKSGGHLASVGYHESKDVAAAVQFVRQQFPQASGRIFYLGHSMGAASILLAPAGLHSYPETLAELTQHLDGIILDCPYADLLEMIHRFVAQLDLVNPRQKAIAWLGRQLSRDGADFSQKVIRHFVRHGHQYLQTDLEIPQIIPAQIFKPHALAQKPLLILHGDADPITPFAHGVQVYETLRETNPNAHFKVLPGAGHLSYTWDPLNQGRAYCAALREDQTFLTSVFSFLEEAGR